MKMHLQHLVVGHLAVTVPAVLIMWYSVFEFGIGRIVKEDLRFQRNNSFELSVLFHIETSHTICSSNQVTGFYMECNVGQKRVKHVVSIVTCQNFRKHLFYQTVLSRFPVVEFWNNPFSFSCVEF